MHLSKVQACLIMGIVYNDLGGLINLKGFNKLMLDHVFEYLRRYHCVLVAYYLIIRAIILLIFSSIGNRKVSKLCHFL